MLHADTKRKIDSLRDTLVGKIPVPHQQVEQITLAFIYKFMSDIDEDNRELGGQSFFNDHYKKYRWENVMDRSKQGHERVLLYSEGLEQMALNEHLPQLFRDIFKGAYLPFKDPVVFDHFLKGVNDFSYDHSEELGNAFEYLLSIMGSQGDAGQFRTPRHIIDFIVAAVDPTKDDTVLDPACGTAGFLIAAYKQILKNNIDPKSGQPGSALSSTERQKLGRHFTGYDISHEMVRLSLANLYLHGFPEPRVYEYDTLSSEERWGDDFSCILANPPFMTPRGGIQPHRRFSVQSRRAEVLFVDYIMEHLTSQGKAGIIVPEGIIFQSGTAYKQLRKMLVEDGNLYAVVSLPSGVFQPYAGVKTCILLIDKPIAQKARDILFVRVENDGFSLSTQRRPVDQNDLPAALDVIGKYKEAVREGRSFSDEAEDESDAILQEEEKKVSAKLISKQDIAESGDYNLSGDRYAKHFVAHVDPVKLTLKVNPVTVKTITVNSPTVRLDSVVEVSPSKTAISDLPRDTEVSFIPMSDLNEGNISFKAQQVKELGEVVKGYTYFQDGDVLLAKITPCFENGKSGLALDLENGIGFGSSEFIVLRPNPEKLLPELLYRFISRKSFIEEGTRHMTGSAGQKRVPTTFVSSYKIAIPPLSAQKEIGAEIDRYQKIIDGARQVIENWEPKIDVDPEWSVVKLGEICLVERGASPRPIEKYVTDNPDGVNWVKIGDTKNSYKYITKTAEKITSEGASKSRKVNVGDFVLSNSMSFGRPYIMKIEGYIHDGWLRLSEDRKRISKDFLYYILSSDIVKNQFENAATGGVVKNLNSQLVKAVEVPLPPLESQNKIVEEIQREEQAIAENRKLIEQMERKIDHILEKI